MMDMDKLAYPFRGGPFDGMYTHLPAVSPPSPAGFRAADGQVHVYCYVSGLARGDGYGEYVWLGLADDADPMQLTEAHKARLNEYMQAYPTGAEEEGGG